LAGEAAFDRVVHETRITPSSPFPPLNAFEATNGLHVGAPESPPAHPTSSSQILRRYDVGSTGGLQNHRADVLLLVGEALPKPQPSQRPNDRPSARGRCRPYLPNGGFPPSVPGRSAAYLQALQEREPRPVANRDLGEVGLASRERGERGDLVVYPHDLVSGDVEIELDRRGSDTRRDAEVPRSGPQCSRDATAEVGDSRVWTPSTADR
jgi:hypothetical protein